MTLRFSRFALCWLFAMSVSAAELYITANALFDGRAMLTINGEQHLLRAGQRSPHGVRLITANAREAVIEVNGQRQTLPLSSQISTGFADVEKISVSLRRTTSHEYIAGGSINGRTIEMLIDTGANVVAMNSRHADRLGIQYQRDGTLTQVRTASGLVKAWSVMLDRVDVAGLTVRQVQASVIEGDFPVTVLLGMSYLNHVSMREQDGILTLER